jgi:putative transposase
MKKPTQSGQVVVLPTAQVLRYKAQDPWAAASASKRVVAVARLDVVQYVRGLEQELGSFNKAWQLVEARLFNRTLPGHIAQAMQACAKAGRNAPAKNTVREWNNTVEAGGGRVELLEQHGGRTPNKVMPAWWGMAIERYNQPSKPDMAEVWRYLSEVEGFAVSYDQVRDYINSLPAAYGHRSPARIGKKLYRLTQKAYIRRCTDKALPGDVYVADGYRADVYLAHPVTGGIWRPELTVIMDLRSRVIVGWRADEHEGAYAVQNTFAEAFARHKHVPAIIYVDNGSGYKNQFMSDPMTGFYARAGVGDVIHAIPGNPHGKGWVERFFKTMGRDFLKGWMPHLYCGDDMAPEALNETVREHKAGRLPLPSLAQFTDAFNDWLTRYNNRPHPEDASRTRASIWAELRRETPAQDVCELKRRVQKVRVQRGTVQQGKRVYRHPDLLQFNGQEVLLEYDLMDNAVGVVTNMEGRWVCNAALSAVIDAIDETRMDEAKAKRERHQIRRKELAIAEDKDRARQVIDADAVAMGVIDMAPATPLLQDTSDDDITLDLTEIFNRNDNNQPEDDL